MDRVRGAGSVAGGTCGGASAHDGGARRGAAPAAVPAPAPVPVPTAVPELLAPAGCPDAFLAALAAGADAVYLGLKRFSARASAVGFSLAELAAACRMAHGRGARVFVAMNVLLRDDELPDALSAAREALAAGADALIVADLGFIAWLRAELPDAELHLSTQAGAHSAAAAALAARELGVTRVTCGRELSVAEIAAMAGQGAAAEMMRRGSDSWSGGASGPGIGTSAGPNVSGKAVSASRPVEIEAFVHGAICICYAGSCSFSALRRGRSANRGDCTQPCRAGYAMVDDEGRCLAGDTALVEPADEGAVADAASRRAPVRRYRHASDLVGPGEKLLCPRDYLGIRHVAELARTGVSALKIEGRMKNPDYVYNVVGCYRAALDALAAGAPLDDEALDRLEARLARSFNRGFTDAYLRGERADARIMSLERSCNQGAAVGRVIERGRDQVTVELRAPVRAGDTLEIRFAPGADAAPDAPKRWPMVPCPVDGAAGERILVRCKRKVGVGSEVYLTRDAGLVADAAAAVEELRGEWSAALAAEACGDGCRAGARDGACDGVMRARCDAMLQPAERTVGSSRIARAACDQLHRDDHLGRIVRLVRRPESVGASAAFDVDEMPAVEAWRLLDDSGSWRGVLPRLLVVLDEVHREGDDRRVRAICRRAAGVVCRNLGQIDIARETGTVFEIAAPIAAWNAESVRALARLGARRVWLPEELPLERVLEIGRAVADGVPEVRLGVIAQGSPQLMITEHCVLTVEGPCTGACAGCPRRRAPRKLADRDGARLPVLVDARGRTRIFDADPRDWRGSMAALREAGVASFMVGERAGALR